jgi:hypothetical protein
MDSLSKPGVLQEVFAEDTGTAAQALQLMKSLKSVSRHRYNRILYSSSNGGDRAVKFFKMKVKNYLRATVAQ